MAQESQIEINCYNLIGFIGPYAQRQPPVFTDFTALSDFFFAFDMIDNGQNDVGHILLTVLGKGQQGFVRTDAKFAARQVEITLGVRCIEADGNRIKDAAFEIDRRITAIFQIRQAIGINPRLDITMMFLI